MLLSAIFIVIVAVGVFQIYRATDQVSHELSAENLRQFKEEGFLPANTRIDDLRAMDFIAADVIHLEPSSLILFAPLILLVAGYFWDRSIRAHWLGRIAAFSAVALYLVLLTSVLACRIYHVDIEI